jgi:nucleoside 2-deoxyribosyltransferase
MLALANFLAEEQLLTLEHANSCDPIVIVKAKGFEAIESQSLSPATTVFISSTCYDVLDLRAELAEFLESKGFIVNLSDDPYRIEVEPTENSIETCRRNVEASDVVVCILDGRYGPPLPPEREVSATHAEIRHARKIKRPVYIFGRDRALAEFDLLRKDAGAKTIWVEKHDPEQRMRWLKFVKELLDLASAEGHSNWVDPFQSSVQLKKLVLKRLTDFRRKTGYY